jgi:transketolase
MPEIKQQQDTRREFVNTLVELAKTDDKIVVIIPDVGFNYLSDPNLPFRVLNLGVTEQTATMIAASLALSGFKVFLYSMINFVLFRNAEMVRNGIVCHNAPVTILGVKGSSSYKFLGFSHNLLHENEDFNFCDNIGLTWKHPESNDEVRADVLESYYSNKPSYIRL